MPTPRFALASDIPRAARTLASAFGDDPVLGWVFRDVEDRYASLERWMRFNLELGLSRGHTYLADEGEACAIWSAPDSPLFDELWGPRVAQQTSAEVGAERAPEVLEGLGQIMRFHPEAPHFYLFILGTNASSQGKGLGATLMAPVLDICDREGLLAFLESSNIANVPFYERHGFEIQEEVPVCEGGPVVRTMLRKPR